jgi:hypothetical protein
MRKAVIPAFLLLLGGTVLGATVLREPVAKAASPIVSVFVNNTAAHPVPVHETNTDANGNINVHEQGTAAVQQAGTPVHIHLQLSNTPYTVPAGKRLIIQYVNATMNPPDNDGAQFALYIGFQQVSVFAGTAEPNSPGWFDVSETVMISAEPGSQLSVISEGEEVFPANIDMFGYLEAA